ncbi:hypothetical protein [Thalassospira marina]|uniref:Uncharacterized protein n=1 Tax=Thalassospira marina TaxID=2048283 RepID=A0A2N3KTN6_9PROT|nr:hypothetical protein [Thalassospira marina]AUG55718.1 hypothetical protein CSC3H3_23000 [Thalassospira marina]PKR53887.1 hypothetical protein COO20_12840 [Thalassospira marina]
MTQSKQNQGSVEVLIGQLEANTIALEEAIENFDVQYSGPEDFDDETPGWVVLAFQTIKENKELMAQIS